MKKPLSILLALAMGCSVVAFTACSGNKGESLGQLRLRSEEEQHLNVGDTYKLVYDARYDGKNVKDEVSFKSSDESVVKVDEYGNMEAVGVGDAVVTLALNADETVNAKCFCTVSKTFFMTKPGYSNGDVDPTTADTEGWVHLKAGSQTQVLVNECSENWYFKTKIEHTGDTGADSNGRWGVGSFLVDKTHEIGNTMAWFGFQPTDHSNKKYTPYVGGWRVQSTGQDPEIALTSQAFEGADFAVLEVIRYGVDHYFTVTVGEQVAKYVYTCNSYDGVATYPGVYSQKQRLYLSEFEATSDLDEVIEKLSNFQNAENVIIEGALSELEQGETYNLVASVLPEYTYDKGVKFSLKEEVEGVSVTESGVLTIGAEATGSVTVVAAATSSEAFGEKTYTIKAKAASTHAVIDTNNIAGASDKYSLTENAVTYEADSGEVYLPLLASGEKWAVTYKANFAAFDSYGVLSATKGLCDYVSLVFGGGKVSHGAMTAKKTEIITNGGGDDTVTVIRDGSFYSIVVRGRLVNRFYSATDGETIPVIYTKGATGTITNIDLVTDSDAVDEIIAQYPHTVGAYVIDNGGGSYKLSQQDFANDGKHTGSDVNWPPVNNYEDGLKFAQTIKGDFTIEFTMSGINPSSDAKVLVYLRSEKTTASLQFVFKNKATFCPNLNDATWDEYDNDDYTEVMGSAMNGGSGTIDVKVVKTGTKVELYLNGTRMFEGNSGLNNPANWNENTEFTPGIGVFKCEVTVSNVKLTVGSAENGND